MLRLIDNLQLCLLENFTFETLMLPLFAVRAAFKQKGVFSAVSSTLPGFAARLLHSGGFIMRFDSHAHSVIIPVNPKLMALHIVILPTGKPKLGPLLRLPSPFPPSSLPLPSLPHPPAHPRSLLVKLYQKTKTSRPVSESAQ